MKGKVSSLYCFIVTLLGLCIITSSHANVKGIYVTQPTVESTRTIKYLIKNSKAVGIDTFVIDVNRKSKRYARNIALVRKSGIRYVDYRSIMKKRNHTATLLKIFSIK